MSFLQYLKILYRSRHHRQYLNILYRSRHHSEQLLFRRGHDLVLQWWNMKKIKGEQSNIRDKLVMLSNYNRLMEMYIIHSKKPQQLGLHPYYSPQPELGSSAHISGCGGVVTRAWPLQVVCTLLWIKASAKYLTFIVTSWEVWPHLRIKIGQLSSFHKPHDPPYTNFTHLHTQQRKEERKKEDRNDKMEGYDSSAAEVSASIAEGVCFSPQCCDEAQRSIIT